MNQPLLFNKILNNPGAFLETLEDNELVEKRRFTVDISITSIFRKREFEITITKLLEETGNLLIDSFAEGLVYVLETNEILCISNVNNICKDIKIEDLNTYNLQLSEPIKSVDVFRFIFQEKVFWFTADGPVGENQELINLINQKKYKDLNSNSKYLNHCLSFQIDNDELVLVRAIERDRYNKFWIHQSSLSDFPEFKTLKTQMIKINQLPIVGDSIVNTFKDGILQGTFIPSDLPENKQFRTECEVFERYLKAFNNRFLQPLKLRNTKKFGPVRPAVFKMIHKYPFATYLFREFDNESLNLETDFWQDRAALVQYTDQLREILNNA